MSDNNVFLILQDTADARPFIDALEQENPSARIDRQPGMVRFDASGELSITRDRISELSGQDIDLQTIHLVLVSLSGNIDEDEDYFKIVRH